MQWLRNVFIAPNEMALIPGAQKQSTLMSIAVGVFAAVGGFIYGYDTGLINSLSEMEYVRHNFASNHVSFTAKETSLITAILSLGTFFGALSAPLLSDTIGRRYTIIIATFIVFIVGNICQVASAGIPLLCVGRFITGLSVGMISAVVPLYQAEASPKFVRGAIISTYQWAITWGLLVSSAVSQGTQSKKSSASYRVPIGLQFAWSLVLGAGMIFLPESPRFYIRKDDLNSAAKSLSTLRRVPQDDPALIEELVEIKASHDYELSFGSYSFMDCFRDGEGRPHQLKRLATGVILQALQQCSGINFIFYYGVNFLSRTGVSKSYLISFVTYAVNVCATIPGIMLVEIIGRRKLLIGGGSIMVLSNLIIAIVGVTTNSVIANKIMIAFVCLFIASFAASWGPVVWVYSGELFSLGVRGKSVAITAATNWLVNFVFAYITPYLVDTGNHTAALGTKIFFIWGGFNLIGVIFVYFAVFETKGLSLEEINELYRECPNARISGKFKVKVTIPDNEREEDEEVIRNGANGVENIELRDTEEKRESSSNGSSFPDSYDAQNSGATAQVPGSENYGMRNFQQPDYSAFNPGYQVDLGYGLGLSGQNRGPPSFASATDDENETEEEEEHITYNSLSEYVSRLSSMSERRSSNQTGVTSTTAHTHLFNVPEDTRNTTAIEESTSSEIRPTGGESSSSSSRSSLFD